MMEPVTFAATCSGIRCTIKIQSNAVHITHPDGRTPLQGVPCEEPLKLIIDIRSSQSPHQTASCLDCPFASVDKTPVSIAFHAESAFDALQRAHVKTRDRLMHQLKSAIAVVHTPHQAQTEPTRDSARARATKTTLASEQATILTSVCGSASVTSGCCK